MEGAARRPGSAASWLLAPPVVGGGGDGGVGGERGVPAAGAPPPHTPSNRLGHAAEKFSAFYNDLEAAKQKRREVEGSRHKQLAEQLAGLEKALEAEVRRRADADAALQQKVAADLRSLEDAVAGQLRELQSGLKASIDALGRTFAELHNGLREEREQRRVDIEHLARSVVSKVDECAAQLDDERVTRLESQASTLKQVGQDILGLQEMVDAERVARETAVQAFQKDLEHASIGRSSTDDQFQAVVLTEISNIKSALAAERDERVSEDEQIVHAINDYTRALQDGLRIVNTG